MWGDGPKSPPPRPPPKNFPPDCFSFFLVLSTMVRRAHTLLPGGGVGGRVGGGRELGMRLESRLATTPWPPPPSSSAGQPSPRPLPVRSRSTRRDRQVSCDGVVWTAQGGGHVDDDVHGTGRDDRSWGWTGRLRRVAVGPGRSEIE